MIRKVVIRIVEERNGVVFMYLIGEPYQPSESWNVSRLSGTRVIKFHLTELTVSINLRDFERIGEGSSPSCHRKVCVCARASGLRWKESGEASADGIFITDPNTQVFSRSQHIDSLCGLLRKFAIKSITNWKIFQNYTKWINYVNRYVFSKYFQYA